MDDEHLINLAPDGFSERIHRRCHPILAPFIVGDRNYPPTGFDAIHPHTQTFVQPLSGAVKHSTPQPVPTRGQFEPPLYPNTDDRHGMPTLLFRLSEICAPGQISLKYHSIKTMKRKERFTLCRYFTEKSNSCRLAFPISQPNHLLRDINIRTEG
jgi:hypothetical protein